MNTTKHNQRTLLAAAATMMLVSFVCSNVATTSATAMETSPSVSSSRTEAKSSATTSLTSTEVHTRQAHKNMATYANQAGQHHQNQQRQQQQQQQHSLHQYEYQQQQQKQVVSEQQQQQKHHPHRGNYRYNSGNINVNGDDDAGSSSKTSLPPTRPPNTATRSRGGVTFMKKSKTRRSYNTFNNAQSDDPTVASAVAAEGTFNDLTNLPTGLQHISDSYGRSVSLPLSAITGRMVREQIPIYEEQQENNYGETEAEAAAAADNVAAAFGASGTPTGTTPPTLTGYVGENNQHRIRSSQFEHQRNDGNVATPGNVALHTAIYNLRAAGTHNGFVPSLSTYAGGEGEGTGTGTGNAVVGHYQFAKYEASTPQEAHNLNDKISADGNFPHHYEQNAVYNEPQTTTDAFNQQQQYQLEQQQQLQQQQEWQIQKHIQQLQQQHQQQFQQEYLASHISNSLHEDNSPASHQVYNDAASDYLPPSHFSNGAAEAPPNVINYVPYPVVKKLHVPIHQPVQIPVSHSVIIPVTKPVPIHIPVTQQVQIPVQKDLKIPIERLVPIPVEKHIPIPVEKRVPYPVVKYVPVKVPRPFPVKVPVFKTILHKIKSWW